MIERAFPHVGPVERTPPTEVVRFIDDLLTWYVTNVMRSAKLRQTQQKWEPNGFNDIVALPVAAVQREGVDVYMIALANRGNDAGTMNA
ncbi:hypothetical protein GCM10027022_04900 [Alpinimonas psychrophila]|uniref:Uncharacterized protein n=1 Tax=Alpinimonas psychrophila TaxID=748908 RepID=A0A7W3JSB5_9MICO|nr:hypothetical protein [Alpinimonas psychrophila]MBA8828311.1 hypothetical protein [Alpinimonas psychrophila]